MIRVVWILNRPRHTRISVPPTHARTCCPERVYDPEINSKASTSGPFFVGLFTFFHSLFLIFSLADRSSASLSVTLSLSSAPRLGPSVIPLLPFHAAAVVVPGVLQKSTHEWREWKEAMVDERGQWLSAGRGSFKSTLRRHHSSRPTRRFTLWPSHSNATDGVHTRSHV